MKCQVFPPNEPSVGILNSLDLPEPKEERDRETSRSPMPINSCQDEGLQLEGGKGSSDAKTAHLAILTTADGHVS